MTTKSEDVLTTICRKILNSNKLSGRKCEFLTRLNQLHSDMCGGDGSPDKVGQELSFLCEALAKICLPELSTLASGEHSDNTTDNTRDEVLKRLTSALEKYRDREKESMALVTFLRNMPALYKMDRNAFYHSPLKQTVDAFTEAMPLIWRMEKKALPGSSFSYGKSTRKSGSNASSEGSAGSDNSTQSSQAPSQSPSPTPTGTPEPKFRQVGTFSDFRMQNLQPFIKDQLLMSEWTVTQAFMLTTVVRELFAGNAYDAEQFMVEHSNTLVLMRRSIVAYEYLTYSAKIDEVCTLQPMMKWFLIDMFTEYQQSPWSQIARDNERDRRQLESGVHPSKLSIKLDPSKVKDVNSMRLSAYFPRKPDSLQYCDMYSGFCDLQSGMNIDDVFVELNRTLESDDCQADQDQLTITLYAALCRKVQMIRNATQHTPSPADGDSTNPGIADETEIQPPQQPEKHTLGQALRFAPNATGAVVCMLTDLFSFYIAYGRYMNDKFEFGMSNKRSCSNTMMDAGEFVLTVLFLHCATPDALVGWSLLGETMDSSDEDEHEDDARLSSTPSESGDDGDDDSYADAPDSFQRQGYLFHKSKRNREDDFSTEEYISDEISDEEWLPRDIKMTRTAVISTNEMDDPSDLSEDFGQSYDENGPAFATDV